MPTAKLVSLSANEGSERSVTHVGEESLDHLIAEEHRAFESVHKGVLMPVVRRSLVDRVSPRKRMPEARARDNLA